MARDVSTAAAVLDAEYSVSEEESDASEALSEEVAATKQQVDMSLGLLIIHSTTAAPCFSTLCP